MILKWGIMNRNIFWHMHTNIGTTSRQLHIYLIKLKSIVYENSYNNICYISHTGGRLNIKKSSYQYRDSHVEDKTVSPTVLSLTWESPYPGKTVFIFLDGALVLSNTMKQHITNIKCVLQTQWWIKYWDADNGIRHINSFIVTECDDWCQFGSPQHPMAVYTNCISFQRTKNMKVSQHHRWPNLQM